MKKAWAEKRINGAQVNTYKNRSEGNRRRLDTIKDLMHFLDFIPVEMHEKSR
jgi:hypothetical protein